jgi:hypothetical protein
MLFPWYLYIVQDFRLAVNDLIYLLQFIFGSRVYGLNSIELSLPAEAGIQRNNK